MAILKNSQAIGVQGGGAKSGDKVLENKNLRGNGQSSLEETGE
jgi:hypothetical protein